MLELYVKFISHFARPLLDKMPLPRQSRGKEAAARRNQQKWFQTLDEQDVADAEAADADSEASDTTEPPQVLAAAGRKRGGRRMSQANAQRAKDKAAYHEELAAHSGGASGSSDNDDHEEGGRYKRRRTSGSGDHAYDDAFFHMDNDDGVDDGAEHGAYMCNADTSAQN